MVKFKIVTTHRNELEESDYDDEFMGSAGKYYNFRNKTKCLLISLEVQHLSDICFFHFANLLKY